MMAMPDDERDAPPVRVWRWLKPPGAVTVLLGLVACAAPSPAPTGGAPPAPAAATPTPLPPPQPRQSAEPLSAEALEAHVRALCAREMAGRAAGSDGEAKAFAYVTRRLEALGLEVEQHPVAITGGTSANRWTIVGNGDERINGDLVVLGAHVDHLGITGGVLYPGAEDNASGVAVALGIAAELVTVRRELERPVLVMFFGAEEVGLVGSKAFVHDHEELVKRTRVMVNLDMVGRPLADRALLSLPKRLVGIDAANSMGVLGTRDRSELRRIVDEAFASEALAVVGLEDLPVALAGVIANIAKDRADSFVFEHAGIPALFFSAGESDDYHLPSDTPERLDYRLLARRGRAIARVVRSLSRASRP